MESDSLERPQWEAFTPDMRGESSPRNGSSGSSNGSSRCSLSSVMEGAKKRKRGGDWHIRQVGTGFKARVQNEDINDTEWSIVDADENTWHVHGSGAVLTMGIELRGSGGQIARCATFDPGQRSLLIELRPQGTPFRRSGASPSIDIPFVLCCFEAVQAIRDEQASQGGRGRRDEIGRLVRKTKSLKQLVERFLGI
ncbi:hypothetical protein OC842_003990 [Tilletia horrida]|uniref:Uncharacterized protein n=1 Tax=Tilletia horrida TaxID=155126 RepID=A0AAN6GCX0_9BASI|nr:hypothetical protein OC842_003990 [Tilletia horrida]